MENDNKMINNTSKFSEEEIDKRIAGMKIMVVEDNELNLDIVREVLREKGLIVTGAENGQIAVDLFRDNPPGTFDAILMDMHMPVMDGVSATKEIRAMERADACTIPILALTANDFEEDIIQTKNAGMNDHLTKPFDMDKVFSTLAEYAVK